MTDSNPTHKGVILKHARESRHVSLEAVHEATKIPMDALKAIEEGYTVRSLSPFYYKGFVKMYAQYLGVDARQIVDDIPSPPSAEKRRPAPVKREITFDEELTKKFSEVFSEQRLRQILIVVGVVLALLIGIKVVGSVMKAWKAKPQKAKVQQVQKPRLKIADSKSPAKKASAPQPSSKPSPGAKSASAVPPKTAAAVNPPIQSVPEPAKSVPQDSAPATVNDHVNLTVRAKRSTWIQVKIDGMVVFQSTLHKGAVETWVAKERIELSGKNVNELELELNGKIIGSLSKADYSARKLIITKEGLTVKQ